MPENPPELELTAQRYARRLLASLGEPAVPRVSSEHPAVAWARSGLMALSGLPDGEPQMCPAPLAACADGALAALAAIAPANAFAGLRGSGLLAERAAIRGLKRAGAASPNGGCNLLDTKDGAIAVTLSRDDDWALVPAWLEIEGEPGWALVRSIVASKTMHDLVERGRLLGLAVAPNVPPPSSPVKWLNGSGLGPFPLEGGRTGWGWVADHPHPNPPPSRGRGQQHALVIDLSSLWAGPLCSHLLQLCGARVIKLESRQRPDGARNGPPAFFDLLNAGKRSVALEFGSERGRAQLRALLARADIVIEGSRPRALRQLGIRAEDLLRENPRLTWIGIGGYGRGEPQENWIAYGDDAGVAAGLSWLMRQVTGLKLISGDAIADPLTGLHAALAGWSSWRQGGGRLISLSLVDVVRHCLQFELPRSVEALRERQREWTIAAQAARIEPPRARTPAATARPLGADTAAALAGLGVPA